MAASSVGDGGQGSAAQAPVLVERGFATAMLAILATVAGSGGRFVAEVASVAVADGFFFLISAARVILLHRR